MNFSISLNIFHWKSHILKVCYVYYIKQKQNVTASIKYLIIPESIVVSRLRHSDVTLWLCGSWCGVNSRRCEVTVTRVWCSLWPFLTLSVLPQCDKFVKSVLSVTWLYANMTLPEWFGFFFVDSVRIRTQHQVGWPDFT